MTFPNTSPNHSGGNSSRRREVRSTKSGGRYLILAPMILITRRLIEGRATRGDGSSLASPNTLSWKQILVWMRELDALRRAA